MGPRRIQPEYGLQNKQKELKKIFVNTFLHKSTPRSQSGVLTPHLVVMRQANFFSGLKTVSDCRYRCRVCPARLATYNYNCGPSNFRWICTLILVFLKLIFHLLAAVYQKCQNYFHFVLFVASVKNNSVGCCFLELLFYTFFAMSLYVRALLFYIWPAACACCPAPPPSVWRSPCALSPTTCQLWLSRLCKRSPNV